jgi:hypothetical protein
MINLQNKKRSEYDKDGDLSDIEEMSKDYWNKSRDTETQTIEDLEKHLWLANAAAATVSIGYIQAKEIVCQSQYYGAWAFVSGILMLVVMKYVSSINSSRDRYRFQDAKSKFDAEEVTDFVFNDVRDKTFKFFKKSYLFLQYGAGVAFISGCIMTLIGVKNAL